MFIYFRSISNNKIRGLGIGVFHKNVNLVSLDLRGNPIKTIYWEVFINKSKLRKL